MLLKRLTFYVVAKINIAKIKKMRKFAKINVVQIV